MTLYTLISDWRGGSTLLQMHAPAPRKAVKKWAHSSEIERIAPFVEIPLPEIKKKLPEIKIQQQTDLKNIWQGELSLKEGSP